MFFSFGIELEQGAGRNSPVAPSYSRLSSIHPADKSTHLCGTHSTKMCFSPRATSPDSPSAVGGRIELILGLIHCFVLCSQAQLCLGPMFAGKSSELIKRIQRHEAAKESCLVVNYAADTRYCDDNCICTHDGVRMNALRCERLEDIRLTARDYSVIGIDEGQFFPDLSECAESLANEGKIVIIAALDGPIRLSQFLVYFLP